MDAGEIVEAGSPEELYLHPKRAETMRYVGFPQANFIKGRLDRRSGTAWLSTPLFEAVLVKPPSEASLDTGASSPSAGSGEVSVGVRPEHILLDPHPPAGALSFKAKVLLREDLGGEEIVYLDAGGQQLTTVLRADQGDALRINIDDSVTAYAKPENAVVYADGRYVGRAG